MHKDTKEALERLEAELLAEEQPALSDEELDELLADFLEEDEDIGDVPHYQNYANGYRAYNSDPHHVDLNVYSDETDEEPRQKPDAAFVLALICLVGSVVALLYMAAQML